MPEPPPPAGPTATNRGVSLARFWAPRHWPTWLLWGAMRATALLPLGVQLKLGRVFGRLLLRIKPRERRIAEQNLAVCFPELPPAERAALHLTDAEQEAFGRPPELLRVTRPKRGIERVETEGEGGFGREGERGHLGDQVVDRDGDGADGSHPDVTLRSERVRCRRGRDALKVL